MPEWCLAYRCSQNFFHACAVAGGPMGPPARGSKDRSGTGARSQKIEILRYYKKCAWHRTKRGKIWWQFGPTRLHSLTITGPGVRGPGAHFPGGGGGTGPNSLPHTIRIAVWEIFSQILTESLCDLGNFFRGSSRYRKIILDQKILIVRARAPPPRRYAKDQNFLATTSLFRELISHKSAQKRKKCEKIHSVGDNKIIVPVIVWAIVWGLTHYKSIN